MKLLLTIALLGAIYLSHSMARSLIDREVSIPPSHFGFADAGQEIKGLLQFSQYQMIADKPLFDPDREPFKAVVEPTIVKQVVTERSLMVQALGIAVTGEIILAVVKDLRTGQISRLKINEELEGWTLSEVSSDSFIFTKGDNEKVVKFKENGEQK